MKSPVGTPLSLMVSVCTLFALLLVGGCKSEEKGRTASLPPPLVGVMTVEERNVPVSFTYAGQTEGSRAVEVRAQVSGILMRRAYNEGQYVKQGQLLFEIEPDTYRAALRQAKGVMEQAQARFTQARQNLNRVLPLYKKNAVSQKDRDDAQAAYDSAKADLDSAKAAVSEAEIKLSHAYVTAPVRRVRQPRIPDGRQPHHRRFAGRQPPDRGEPERSHLRQLRHTEPAVHAPARASGTGAAQVRRDCG